MADISSTQRDVQYSPTNFAIVLLYRCFGIAVLRRKENKGEGREHSLVSVALYQPKFRRPGHDETICLHNFREASTMGGVT